MQHLKKKVKTQSEKTQPITEMAVFFVIVACLYCIFDCVFSFFGNCCICAVKLSLSPRNYVSILLNCLHNYVVVTNIIPAWIMFKHNVSLKQYIHITRSMRTEVSGVDDGCTLTPQSELHILKVREIS